MAIYNVGAGNGGSGATLVFLSTNKNSITLTPNKTSDTFTIGYDGDGVLSAESIDTSVATVELVSGTTYRVTMVTGAFADTEIKISASVGTKTVPANEVTVKISAISASSTLNNNSWEDISKISNIGVGSSFWSVGDTKAITLNGTVGTLVLSNVTLYAYILGFDHNSEIEGSGISFGTFKTAQTGGKDVALVDSNNGETSYNGTKYFQMNHWGNQSQGSGANYGGWAACDMRYDILGSTDVAPRDYGSQKTTRSVGYDATPNAPLDTATTPIPNTLMAALPSELRYVMKPITKYTDNVGGGSENNQSETIDYLPLLSEYEVFGYIGGGRADPYEKEWDQHDQYRYYKNGNSNIKYKHNDVSTSCVWWERSPDCLDSTGFCVVYYEYVEAANCVFSYGIAPVFLV